MATRLGRLKIWTSVAMVFLLEWLRFSSLGSKRKTTGKGKLVGVVAIIQARMSSNRLRGKVLMPLAGEPLLAYVVHRVKMSRVGQVVVATSGDASDNQVEAFCREEGIACIRGELENVSARFQLVLEKTEANGFVRICADSPFIDPALVGQAVLFFDRTKADVVTNVFPRTFPKGQSVEVVRSDVFLRSQPFSSAECREHVTKYFYENSGKFKIENFSSGGQWNSCNMCVDTAEDLQRAEFLVEKAGPGWMKLGWRELMEMMPEGGA